MENRRPLAHALNGIGNGCAATGPAALGYSPRPSDEAPPDHNQIPVTMDAAPKFGRTPPDKSGCTRRAVVAGSTSHTSSSSRIALPAGPVHGEASTPRGPSINLLSSPLAWPRRNDAHGKAWRGIWPRAVAGWQETRFDDQHPPDVVPLVLAVTGAIAVNGTGLAARRRPRHGG